MHLCPRLYQKFRKTGCFKKCVTLFSTLWWSYVVVVMFHILKHLRNWHYHFLNVPKILVFWATLKFYCLFGKIRKEESHGVFDVEIAPCTLSLFAMFPWLKVQKLFICLFIYISKNTLYCMKKKNKKQTELQKNNKRTTQQYQFDGHSYRIQINNYTIRGWPVPLSLWSVSVWKKSRVEISSYILFTWSFIVNEWTRASTWYRLKTTLFVSSGNYD